MIGLIQHLASVERVQIAVALTVCLVEDVIFQVVSILLVNMAIGGVQQSTVRNQYGYEDLIVSKNWKIETICKKVVDYPCAALGIKFINKKL